MEGLDMREIGCIIGFILVASALGIGQLLIRAFYNLLAWGILVIGLLAMAGAAVWTFFDKEMASNLFGVGFLSTIIGAAFAVSVWWAEVSEKPDYQM
jgi:hypothetical protein